MSTKLVIVESPRSATLRVDYGVGRQKISQNFV